MVANGSTSRESEIKSKEVWELSFFSNPKDLQCRISVLSNRLRKDVPKELLSKSKRYLEAWGHLKDNLHVLVIGSMSWFNRTGEIYTLEIVGPFLVLLA